jgi:hypothetical protein
MRGWINTSGRLGSAECESERPVHVCTRIYAGIQCFSCYGVETSIFIEMPRSRRGRSAILVRPPNPLNAESLHAVCRKLTRTEASCPAAGLLHLFLLLLLHRRRDLLTHAFLPVLPKPATVCTWPPGFTRIRIPPANESRYPRLPCMYSRQGRT